MIIEIRRAGFVNKGAELMLLAAYEKLKAKYPDATFVMEPTTADNTQPFDKIIGLGFKLKANFIKRGFQFGNMFALFPKKIRDMYGIVLESEIDLVVDAAGFLYSDQWDIGFTEELVKSIKRWKKNNTKLIMLPQAFGPFKDPSFNPLLNEVANYSSLIFTRELDSYKHLTRSVGKLEKINVSCDFTNLIQGEVPVSFNNKDKKIAIIPNCRMLDKTTDKKSESYIPFMVKCVRHLLNKNTKPFLLLHEGKGDLEIACLISEEVGGIPIHIETNALGIKGIIGKCDAVIGSRFHSLVSALSQGVPCIATGWSHKYHRLFDDYNVPNYVVSVLEHEKDLFEKIDDLIDENKVSKLKSKIIIESIVQKKSSEKMWEKVFEITDSLV